MKKTAKPALYDHEVEATVALKNANMRYEAARTRQEMAQSAMFAADNEVTNAMAELSTARAHFNSVVLGSR